MLNSKPKPHCLIMLLICGCLTGCSGDANVENRIGTIPTNGVVKLDGVAVGQATVIFHSTDHKVAARGMTNDEGEFSLTTYEQDDGAVPGKHTVTIEKVEQRTTPDPRGEPHPPKVEEIWHLPKRYADAKTTDLTATITKDKKEHLFDLKSK